MKIAAAALLFATPALAAAPVQTIPTQIGTVRVPRSTTPPP